MATRTDPVDVRHMRAALGLARRALGTVAPNPAVGCVLVRAGRVVGRGWTQPGGRPHAESEALARAGDQARGASAYVTLEPCAHHGKTPPCADALIAAGVARVIVAIEDPDPRVNGAGIERLRAAGIVVTTDVCAREAATLNAGFISRIVTGRPLVTLKTATTLDGRIATRRLESRWITGQLARDRSQYLRAVNDAVMVGIGTVQADDPRLTCRLPGLESRHPVRIIVDGRLRLPLTSALVITANETPTWLVCLPGGDAQRRRAYRDCGVELIDVEPDASGRPDIVAMMKAFGARGITRLLFEGGGHLTAALLRAECIDRIAWFRATGVMGGDGVPVAGGFGVERLTEMPLFDRLSITAVGDDLLEVYQRRV